jgi:hypothetical protein
MVARCAQACSHGNRMRGRTLQHILVVRLNSWSHIIRQGPVTTATSKIHRLGEATWQRGGQDYRVSKANSPCLPLLNSFAPQTSDTFFPPQPAAQERSQYHPGWKWTKPLFGIKIRTIGVEPQLPSLLKAGSRLSQGHSRHIHRLVSTRHSPSLDAQALRQTTLLSIQPLMQEISRTCNHSRQLTAASLCTDPAISL